MTNYVIEGCDGVGKTSLVQEFLKHGQFEIKKCSAPPNNLTLKQQRDHCKKEYEQAIEYLNTHDNVIYDRCFLGEAVYAPIFRGYFPSYLRELEKQLNDNTQLVVLIAKPRIVQKRYDGKFIKPEHIKPIHLMFQAQYLLSNAKKKMLINTSWKTPREIYELIKKRQH